MLFRSNSTSGLLRLLPYNSYLRLYYYGNKYYFCNVLHYGCFDSIHNMPLNRFHLNNNFRLSLNLYYTSNSFHSNYDNMSLNNFGLLSTVSFLLYFLHMLFHCLLLLLTYNRFVRHLSFCIDSIRLFRLNPPLSYNMYSSLSNIYYSHMSLVHSVHLYNILLL